MEPLIRESLELAAATGELPWECTTTVGGWWNRRFNPEVDLVGADTAPVAGRIDFAGSIKWLESPFDEHDLRALQRDAPQVPGYEPGTTGLVVASLSGTTAGLRADRVDLFWGPEEFTGVWQTG